MKRALKVKIGAWTIILMGCGALTGCIENNVYNPDLDKPVLKPESEYFDFATTGEVAFDINYGKIAAGALLEVYIKEPITYNEDGSYTISSEANYKAFTDQNGCFKGKVELPTAVKKVYIYSSNWGAPMCIEAVVENKKVIVDITQEATVTRANTRVSANLSVMTINTNKNLYSIVDWGRYGKITTTNDLVTTGNLDADVIGKLQKTLWQGATAKPYNLNNSHLVKDTKHINTTIARAYKNEQGQTVNVIDAEVFLTFLTERADYQSTIGYYYYKTGQAPSSPANLKKYVVVPNASMPYDALYNGGNSANAPINRNTKIQLLFQDEDGKISTKFPGGYTIGYFIISDGFAPGTSNSNKGTIKTDNSFVYSDKDWNALYGGKKERFISLSTSQGAVIYGVEDGADTSYEDILFCIEANPNEAIQDPERPTIDPEAPEVSTVETTYRSYAYEDVWPTGGDYDLNDAIIEHKRAITITGTNNYVTKVVDTFTPVQQSNAAQYKNAFAVQYNSNQRGTIVLPQGAIDETETSSVILFEDAMAVRNKPFEVTRTFNKTLKKQDLITDMNPFIIKQYVVGANNRTEIHMPKKKATSKADPTQIGAKEDAYYIDKSGKYPFAIQIPLRTGSGAENAFIPSTEKESIDLNYPDFSKWVKGEGYEDWYLNRKSGN